MPAGDSLRSTRGRFTLQGLCVFGGGDMALELRPNCEYCDKDLPPDASEARICSFECTFYADCVERRLSNVCPNCGGGFMPRPIRPAREWRPGASLAKRPASTKRVGLSSQPRGGRPIRWRGHRRSAREPLTGLSHRRSLRAHLRLADIVDIIDIVAEIGGPLAVRPAGQIDPDHRHRLHEVDVVARAFLDFVLQRRLVPSARGSTTRALQQPCGVIVNALHPDT